MNGRRVTAAVCGILATALGGAAGHLVAALVSPSASPVLAVGGQVIDLAPTPVKEWAVGTFGTADKPILVGSVVLVTLLLAALAGLLRLRSRAAAVTVLLVLTALAGAAAVLRPQTGSFAWVPALTAAVVGVAALELLAHRTGLIHQGRSVPGEPTRRGLLVLGGAGLGAVALGGGGQALVRRRAPTTITLPRSSTRCRHWRRGSTSARRASPPSSRRTRSSTGSTPPCSCRRSTPGTGR
ncbi:hypothetical protein [Janibacter sp. DB-40]|uniref:hypothetical protein n=1 Tax=Janibacter sp. DB-40 TaxID=3028808 RepID=UPI002405F654|nr:hypothetical protein [Janibacter sp. DB-40]